MDLLVLAKCGLLQQVIGAYLRGPYWQTVLASALFAIAQAGGLYWAARRENMIPPRHRLVLALKIGVVLVVSMALACVIVGGVQYLFFILRISKDTLYCSYFEATREVGVIETAMLAGLFVANILIASRFAMTGLPPDPAWSAADWLRLIAVKGFSLLAMASAYLLSLWLDADWVRLVVIVLLCAAVVAANARMQRRLVPPSR